MRRRLVVTTSALALTLGLAIAMTADAPVTRAVAYDIDIVDFAFEPAELTVFVGEPVTWTNRGSEVHTVTSDDGVLDSGDNEPGVGYGHVFEVPGVYRYHCIHHPGMQGTITVLAAPATPIPSGPPEPTPPPGTLPPNFSPFPTTGPIPTPTPALTAAPAPTATAAPTPGPARDNGVAVLVVILLVAVVAGAAIAVNRRRRAP